MSTTENPTPHPNAPDDLDPGRWFSPPPGTDGTLIEREAIRDWLRRVASSLPHVEMREFGTSTEGRPLDAIFVGSDLARRSLDDIRAEREAHIGALLHRADTDKASQPVALVTSGIHATEVGGPQSIPHLVWWLATAPEAALVRDRVITIIAPTLNPDGFDLITRWHRQTLGTDGQGSNPPLLYHRFAGHDNNRDWIFRNLVETRAVLDELHARWLPHLTLDQHQMSRHGPRFALPPYADPWEPHIHPAIIAASSALGQAVASDMALAGLKGVVTGRYFDVWEPSRALQHYRGGIRILAEAASAALAHPIEVSPEDLVTAPMPQPLAPGTDCPLPWPGGRWGLPDIVRYHLQAAKSLLMRAAEEPDRWLAVQRAALAADRVESHAFTVPMGRGAIDRAANRRLAAILDAAGHERADIGDPTWPSNKPIGPLLDALLLPKTYPSDHGQTAYDLTTHHLPLIMGATVQPDAMEASEDPPPDVSGRYLLIDARSHAAPNAVEPVLDREPAAAWRATSRAIIGDQLVEPGTWLIDKTSHPRPGEVASIASASTDVLPKNAVPVARRHILLLDIADEQSEDHGWTRWWLHARSIPFLETSVRNHLPMDGLAPSTTILIADTSRANVANDAIEKISTLIAAGATAIALGASGHLLAEALGTGIGIRDLSRHSAFKAPGALVRVQPEPGAALGLGLDRWIPALFQRDGAFAVSRSARQVEVLARFAPRDTLVSGWMSTVEPLRNAPAVLRILHGGGTLYAFAFRPLFRGQTLVTSPLVHNLLYAPEEPTPCLPSDREKRRDASTSGRIS